MLQHNQEAMDAEVSQETIQEGFQRRPEGLGRRPRILKESLPTITAVSTVAAATAPAASATTATPMTAASAAITTTASATSTAPAATLSLRPGFIDYEVPPAEILTVQRVDRAVGVFVALHFHEGKAAGLSREAITNEIDTRGSYANLCEPFLQLLFRRGKRKIADVELLHLPLLLPGTQVRVAERAEGQLPFTGSRESRATAGSETGTSAVRGMVSKINWFCNRKETDAPAQLPANYVLLARFLGSSNVPCRSG